MAARLRFADEVTAEHGAIFADECIAATGCDSVWEAFETTGLITWPEERRAQGRYQNLEDEILDLTFGAPAVRAAIAEAFVKAAREVIERERSRPRKGKSR